VSQRREVVSSGCAQCVRRGFGRARGGICRAVPVARAWSSSSAGAGAGAGSPAAAPGAPEFVLAPRPLPPRPRPPVPRPRPPRARVGGCSLGRVVALMRTDSEDSHKIRRKGELDAGWTPGAGRELRTRARIALFFSSFTLRVVAHSLVHDYHGLHDKERNQNKSRGSLICNACTESASL
jgi:hypothetical protein